ncbi:tetratricopeptide repeat protein [Hymenobacter sp.]|jgi:tetratricopeptide (TPR) repeat protein|uniref:tetratricopeptide repeat protein n=1 Tax=Hymenobacter sp. TaxID=1898978 RepID=UPI002ED78F15
MKQPLSPTKLKHNGYQHLTGRPLRLAWRLGLAGMLGAALVGLLVQASFGHETAVHRYRYQPVPLHITMCGSIPLNETDTTKKAQPYHDCHAPVTSYVDQLPRPQQLPGIGSSHLPITTTSDSAQRYFDQGLSLLHDFWDFEAYRAFKYASRLDSTAAMPYWGLVLALDYNPDRRKERQKALTQAKKLSAKASAPEKLYIRAIIAEDSVGEEKGQAAFKHAMEELVHRYPNDVEAQLVLWLHGLDLRNGYSPTGAPTGDTMYGQLLLEKLLVRYPNHPAVHHYWIHQMENCCPEQALASADRLASLTPNSGHMVHMPGHIYYRMGQYAKARNAFIASMRVDSAYMAKQHIQQIDNWNYQHNLNYLIANCAEEGRYQEAARWLRRLQDVPPPVDQQKDRLKAYRSSLLTRQLMNAADLEIRFGYWERAAAIYERISDTDSLLTARASSKTLKNVLLHYARGMAAIDRKQYEQAQRCADALDALLWRATKQEKITGLSGRMDNYFNLSSLELRGNLLSATGYHTKALALLQQAQTLEQDLGYNEPPPYARPVAESIALAHLRAKQYDKARLAYESILQARPSSGFALAGIAETHVRAGNVAEARRSYQQLRTAWKNADPNLRQMKESAVWLRSHKSSQAQAKL